MRGLERPHPAAEPIEQREILRQTAEDRLHQMHVRLDEPGHDVVAGPLEHLGILRRDRALTDT